MLSVILSYEIIWIVWMKHYSILPYSPFREANEWCDIVWYSLQFCENSVDTAGHKKHTCKIGTNRLMGKIEYGWRLFSGSPIFLLFSCLYSQTRKFTSYKENTEIISTKDAMLTAVMKPLPFFSSIFSTILYYRYRRFGYHKPPI